MTYFYRVVYTEALSEPVAGFSSAEYKTPMAAMQDVQRAYEEDEWINIISVHIGRREDLDQYADKWYNSK